MIMVITLTAVVTKTLKVFAFTATNPSFFLPLPIAVFVDYFSHFILLFIGGI